MDGNERHHFIRFRASKRRNFGVPPPDEEREVLQVLRQEAREPALIAAVAKQVLLRVSSRP